MSNENPREVYYSVDGQEDDPAVVALRDYVESLGGTEWARYFYPHLFDRPFTQYQIDYWQWIDLIEQFEYYRPRVECEPRGVGKSTNAEASVVKLVATGMKKMVGYVSLNEDKAQKHFNNIKAMFESSKLQRIYPGCSPKVQKLQNKAAQWSREAIVCQNGAMVVPLTLLGSSRGWKSEEGYRFDLIVLDDIDALGQSPEFTAKLIELLKGEILAAGDDNTLVIMPQNLIYRDSICSQIYDYRADIMTNRDFRGPYPLLKGDYEAEKVELPGGGREWRITKAEPFDAAIPVSYAEKLLNLYGKQTFDRECQQKVFEIEEDKDFREWNEQFHIITVSEFRRKMEELGEPVWNEQRNCLQIPPRWNVGLGLDWGCLTLDTEILTKEGWKTHDQLEIGELVAGYDWENKHEIVWTPLNNIIHKAEQKLVEMRRKSFRFVCTPDHAWIIKRKKRGRMTQDTYRRQNLDTIPKTSLAAVNFVISGICNDSDTLPCSPAIAAVLGWLVTDGWEYKKKGGGVLCQKNYVDSVIKDLTDSGLKWNELKTNKDGVRQFYLPKSEINKIKELTGYTDKNSLPSVVTKLSPLARQEMMRAMLEAEGTKNGAERITIFCQKRGAVMDAFQILATLCGQRLGVEREHQSEFGTSNRIPLLRHSFIQYPDITELEGLHNVWCPSVNEGAVVARYKGQVAITGNTTRKHPSVTTFSAKPAENSPLKDCQFMFGEICKPKFPLDSFESPEIVSVGRVATAIREFLDLWNVRDSQVVLRLMSHEASAALNTMAVDLPEETAQFFNKWKAEKGSGVPQIQNLLEINPNKSHPFRRYPNGYKINDIDYSGLPLRGSPKIFFIVPDDQGALRIDVTGQLFVMGAKNALGFARARFEIPIYSFRNQGDKKIDDDFCFVAGTEILTSDGLKPIEKITTNDKVLTRKGWRKVLNCGVTNENAKTFTLTTLDGKKLTGTGNHPIFTSRGVVALRGLAKNDKIYVWKKKSSSTKTLNFIGIPKQNNRRTENIFNRIFTPERKEFLISTLKYGKTILAKFQKDITSTIKTTITTIIQSKTLNVCPAINILPNINQAFPNVVNHQNIWNILKKSEKKLPNGINLPKGRNGTKNTESSFGKTKNLLPEIVTSAELNINQLDKEQDFVQIVADGVLMIEENEQRVKVFNLKVEDCPEYFANGILVHNCDAWRGLENVFGVPSQGKTHEEKVEDKMPDPVKQENLDREFEDPHEKDMLMQRRAIEEKRINRDLKKPILPPGMAKFRRR